MERMKRVLVVGMALAAVLWGINAAWAADAEQSLETVAAKTTKSEGVTLLKGDGWNKLTQGEKLAFIWGAGHVVDIEQELMAQHPELKVENFSAKVVEGIADVPMNQIVTQVDAFYKANPDKTDMPVIAVIWDSMVKPNLTTGIAGKPLE